MKELNRKETEVLKSAKNYNYFGEGSDANWESELLKELEHMEQRRLSA